MTKLDTKAIIAILKETAAGFSQHAEPVQKLDAMIADGDMGVTVELASKAMTDYLANPGEDDIGKLLMKCGMQINKMSPSTFGTLLAAAFVEAGKAVLGKTAIEFNDLLTLGRGAVDGIKKRGKAEVGDKTMLDTLVPAVDAFQKAMAKGDQKAALEAALKGAKTGMEATVNMKAKFSRASYRQDGGMGVQDAGATAMYYLIEAFVKAVQSRI
jgi:phosphoenolpyruvate---glycerone phosphotransferase subunit DhaL